MSQIQHRNLHKDLRFTLARAWILQFNQDNLFSQSDELLTFLSSWQPGNTSRERSSKNQIQDLLDTVFGFLEEESADSDALRNTVLLALKGNYELHDSDAYNLRSDLDKIRNEYKDALSLVDDPTRNFDSEGLIGNAASWKAALHAAARAARRDFPVLITGESGSGKELIARAIHKSSRRANWNCEVINCGALSENLMESELFGYEGGAFTGALREGRPGRLALADRGTLILDEICDLSPHAQGALLRALQDGHIQRVGGGTAEADFRLISLSNKSLEEEVAEGNFRRDLYYRVAVLFVDPPPLRKRVKDIRLLVTHFIDKLKADNPEQNAVCCSEDAAKKLEKYSWRGNVRELENVIKRATVLCGGSDIQPEHLIFRTIGGINRDEVVFLANSIKEIPGIPIIQREVIKLSEFLLENARGFKSGAYSKEFDCGPSTATRHLGILWKAGVLTRDGLKKATTYFLNASFIEAA